MAWTLKGENGHEPQLNSFASASQGSKTLLAHARFGPAPRFHSSFNDLREFARETTVRHEAWLAMKFDGTHETRLVAGRASYVRPRELFPPPGFARIKDLLSKQFS